MTPVGMMESGVLLKLRSGWSTGTREYIVGISIVYQVEGVSVSSTRRAISYPDDDSRGILLMRGNHGYF